MKHYSKNDILSLQLKYKANDEVLDLIAAVDEHQDNAEYADEYDSQLHDAIGTAEELRNEVKTLTERIKQLEETEVKK